MLYNLVLNQCPKRRKARWTLALNYVVVLKKSLTVVVMMIAWLTHGHHTLFNGRSTEGATDVEKCVVYVCKAEIIIIRVGVAFLLVGVGDCDFFG